MTTQDFDGRATNIANFINDTDDVDETGHGTHVAGTVGSTTYGVAKKTTIYSVKVLGVAGGTIASVTAGLDFVISDAPTRNCPNGALANMSIGYSRGVSSVIDEAVRAVVAAGIFLAVAAGNDGDDVFWHSPGHVADVCTVAAVDSTNRRATFSNYGAGIDVLAPGVNVTSLAVGGGTVSISIS